MMRWLRLWPTLLAATLLFAAIAVAAASHSAVRAEVRVAVGRLSAPGPACRHDLTVLHRVHPEYPTLGRLTGGERARCLARVEVGPDGVPTAVRTEGCGWIFSIPTERALMQWRWSPWCDEVGRPASAATTIGVNYVLEERAP